MDMFLRVASLYQKKYNVECVTNKGICKFIGTPNEIAGAIEYVAMSTDQSGSCTQVCDIYIEPSSISVMLIHALWAKGLRVNTNQIKSIPEIFG